MATGVPSPLLPPEQVEAILAEGLAALGAMGGRVGAGGAGASGGTRGGRVGAKVTSLDGDARTLDVPCTAEGVARLEEAFQDGLRVLTNDDDRWEAVAVVGAGMLGMNPAVVQLSWGSEHVMMTAHAREGLIRQRTARKALDQVKDVIEA